MKQPIDHSKILQSNKENVTNIASPLGMLFVVIEA